MSSDRPVLEHLEPTLLASEADEAEAVIAFLALERLTFSAEQLGAAIRRALLVLAAGGSLRRELSLDDPAVTGLAADLDGPDRRAELTEALEGLLVHATGLSGAERALRSLLRDPDRAWRTLAAAILADELSGDVESLARD